MYTKYESFSIYMGDDLSLELIYILEELVRRGNGEWDDKKIKAQCTVLARSIQDWANIILKYANDNIKGISEVSP